MTVELDLPLIMLDDSTDHSGNNHDATLHDVNVDGGANFDGSGDYITISSFEYATDATFSISFWMTKETCTDNYEYMYSHQQDAESDAMVATNSNINLFLACESAGAGWSTTGGSVVRFLLRDNSGSSNFARFDYPLHEAGDFDEITFRWIHIVLSVTPSQIETYSDGQSVLREDLHFYVGDVGESHNVAYPDPTSLSSSLVGFTLTDDIYLGSRSDQAVDRHFVGRLAGLVVGPEPFTTAEAQCLFYQGDEYVPAGYSECSTLPRVPAEVALSLVGDPPADPPTDDSGNGHRITNHGGVMTSSGASFSLGSYLTVEPFDYASDSTFSVSMWVAKEQCAEETHEYLYSHMEQQTGTWDTDSYALMMFLCEETGAFASTVDGSVLRYDIHDTAGQRGTFDFSVHEAGDFDAITSRWLHVIWTVSPTAMASFVDGAPAVVDQYGFFTGLTEGQNIARPHPDQLEPALGALNLQTGIYLGGRFDGDAARAFRGNLALVNIYGRVVTADEAACIFHDGDALLSLGFLSGGRRSLSAAWAVNKTSL
jgi:hypothetical protein